MECPNDTAPLGYPSTTEPTTPKVLCRMSRKQRGKRYDRKLCFVYGLIDGFGDIRYIGQTKSPLAKRLAYHFKDAKQGKTPLHKWIQSSPGIDIFLIDGNATWDVSEILYIDRFRREGHDLVNVLRGGADTIHAIRREAVS